MDPTHSNHVWSFPEFCDKQAQRLAKHFLPRQLVEVRNHEHCSQRMVQPACCFLSSKLFELTNGSNASGSLHLNSRHLRHLGSGSVQHFGYNVSLGVKMVLHGPECSEHLRNNSEGILGQPAHCHRCFDRNTNHGDWPPT